MHRRKLEELNLLDDFLFNKMVSHPEFGEEFTRELLRIILEKEVGKLEVIPQKIYYGSDTDIHGARLDVYLEETEDFLENATIYDLEPEGESKEEDLKSLARRIRFYHSKIDVGSLKSGQEYDDGAKTIFLYTKGIEGNPKKELIELLRYMESSCDSNVTNESLKKIDRMMKRIKSDEEVSLEYMKIYERERMLTEQEAEKNARNLFANGADF